MVIRASHKIEVLVLGLAIAATMVFAPPTVGGETTAEAKEKPRGDGFGASKKEPIVITSDRMEVDRKKNLVSYSGRVVAVQGQIRVTSATLIAYYQPDMRQIREVVAEGDVHVTYGERVATAEKAVFSGTDQTITLFGDAVVRQGKSQVTGSKIIFYMEEDRAVAEGGKQRVKATIFPGDLQGGGRQKEAGKEKR